MYYITILYQNRKRFSKVLDILGLINYCDIHRHHHRFIAPLNTEDSILASSKYLLLVNDVDDRANSMRSLLSLLGCEDADDMLLLVDICSKHVSRRKRRQFESLKFNHHDQRRIRTRMVSIINNHHVDDHVIPPAKQKRQWKQLQFMNGLAKDLELTCWQDWYRLCNSSILKRRTGGKTMLHRYNNSPSALLQSTYPQYPWKAWLFEHVPVGYWQNTVNRFQYLNWLANELDLKNWEDWYSINGHHIRENGGSGLLLSEHNSPTLLITSVYPQYPWQVWRFQTVPHCYWDDKVNQFEYVKWLAREFNVQATDDWYQLTYNQISAKGGTRLLFKYNNSPMLLINAHSECLTTKLQQYNFQAGFWTRRMTKGHPALLSQCFFVEGPIQQSDGEDFSQPLLFLAASSF